MPVAAQMPPCNSSSPTPQCSPPRAAVPAATAEARVAPAANLTFLQQALATVDGATSMSNSGAARPPIRTARCIESKSFDLRKEGACVWSQATCHPFMIRDRTAKRRCVVNQCEPPCATAELAAMRFPQLRPSCRVPRFCLAASGHGARASTLPATQRMCGYDDMAAKSAFEVQPAALGGPAPGDAYERSFYVYGFGGKGGACEFYHVWIAVARYFALVREEFGGRYPAQERIIFIVNSALQGQFRKCEHVRTLFAALSPRLVFSGCTSNAVFGLPQQWLGNWNPLPWRPVIASFVQTFDEMRTLMLERVLGWSADQISANDACGPARTPRLFFVQRSGNRDILHGDVFVKAAREVGFNVTVGDHTGNLKTQMLRVATQDVLIGRHGAGLVWVPMLRKNGILVEMVARGVGNTAGEYFAQWDRRDPHFLLYANWALGSGKSYLYWEASEPAPGVTAQVKTADWKWGTFVVDETSARRMARTLFDAVSAPCQGRRLPPEVAHWDRMLSPHPPLPEYRPNLTTHFAPAWVPPYMDCPKAPCGWRPYPPPGRNRKSPNRSGPHA